MLNNFEKECIAQSHKARLSAAKKKLAKKGEDHNDNQRIKNEIKKLETEPLPIKEPDEKVLSALWSLYGLKGEEYSDDERMGLLAVWIEILYGKEVLEDLGLESKVKKIIARQKRLNEPHGSENKSNSHQVDKNAVDALIYKISESLPEYESDGLVWAETLGLEPWAESVSKDEGDREDCKSEYDGEDRSENEGEVKSENQIVSNIDKLDKEGNCPSRGFNPNIVAGCILLVIGALFLFCTNAPESEEQHGAQTNNYVKSSNVEPSDQETVQVFYQKPFAGPGCTLSIPELRWCVREFSRIDIMKEWISETTEFNDLVANFDRRCGHADFSKEDLDIATREVNVQYNQICTDAIADAKVILQSYQHQQSPIVETSPDAPPTLDSATILSFDQIQEAQKLLAILGYNTGPVTGTYNDQTFAAVLQFEKNHNKTQDGRLDYCLLADIRKSYLIHQTPKKVRPAKRKQPSNIFSKGSQKSLVIKLQGEPDSVTEHHTYEILHYGYSFVKVSLNNHKVLDWYNTSGNLKVKR